MSRQGSLWDTASVTSLLGLEDGPGRCGLPGGPMIGQCGPDHVLARVSARQAEAEGLLTSGTYGRTGSTLSGSSGLQSSLASRLRRNLPYPGLTLFRMTWRVRVTPSGRLICALRASGRSTSGKGCGSWATPDLTSWATPATRDYRHANGKPWVERGGGKKGEQLNNQAVHLAAWQTPTHQDASGGPRTPDKKRGAAPGNQAIAKLTHWPTPSAQGSAGEISEDLERKGEKWVNRVTGRVLQTNLATDVKMLAPWSTPNAFDAVIPQNISEEARQRQLKRGKEDGTTTGSLAKDVWKVISGPPPSGSPAGTGSSGQLNPNFVRFLMGYPVQWDVCAPAKIAKKKEK
jgi:hypothetical protein